MELRGGGSNRVGSRRAAGLCSFTDDDARQRSINEQFHCQTHLRLLRALKRRILLAMPSGPRLSKFIEQLR
jgi:hypothetical protein